MKELLDVCSTCRYSDMKSDFPNIWCDKFIATLNGLSVKIILLLKSLIKNILANKKDFGPSDVTINFL